MRASRKLARPKRFELLTPRFVVWRTAAIFWRSAEARSSLRNDDLCASVVGDTDKEIRLSLSVIQDRYSFITVVESVRLFCYTSS
jgi:hypothetical protein